MEGVAFCISIYACKGALSILERAPFVWEDACLKKLEHHIPVGREKLRCGYTTGTCAAAAARFAAEYLLSGAWPDTLLLETPAGITVEIESEECTGGVGKASCAVRKDGGDDPDVTDGTLIFAEVARTERPGITIDGGIGVGRVTRPGMDQPPGAAAINHVPRAMITRELEAALREHGAAGGFSVTISVPEGERLAKKTFNPKLGVEGGISILGTSGIVKPMSEQTLTASIFLELDMLAASGVRDIIITPGNYGRNFCKDVLDLHGKNQVMCSNYLGDTLDHAAALGFRSVLVVGHLGKLCKVAAGNMNTHSRVSDARCETMAAHTALCGAATAVTRAVFDSVTIDGAIEQLDLVGFREPVMESITDALDKRIKDRMGGDSIIEAIVFSNKYGILGKTRRADALIGIHERKDRSMVHFIGAGPGAEDLITVRGARLLGEADIIIYAGSLVNPALLNYKKENCIVYDSASMTLEDVVAVMSEGERSGKMTVRLHTGDPALYGAIREQMDLLDEQSISYDVTPGVSAFSGAAAAVQAEYTLPDVSQSVIITRMAGRTPVPDKERLALMAAHGCTMVLFLSTGLLEDVERELMEGGYSPDTPAAIVYKATWPEQRVHRCTVSTLAETAKENNVTKTALILIGGFLGDRYARSKLYDPAFTHGYRQGMKQ